LRPFPLPFTAERDLLQIEAKNVTSSLAFQLSQPMSPGLGDDRLSHSNAESFARHSTQACTKSPAPGKTITFPNYSTPCLVWFQIGPLGSGRRAGAARPPPARFAGQLRRVPPVRRARHSQLSRPCPAVSAAAAGPVFRWGQAEPPTRARPARSRTQVRVRTHLPRADPRTTRARSARGRSVHETRGTRPRWSPPLPRREASVTDGRLVNAWERSGEAEAGRAPVS